MIIEEQEEELTSIIDEELKNAFTTKTERNKEDMDNEIEKHNLSLTNNFTIVEDKYVTYKVHILRDNETIELIMDKYNITKDELKKYNDLENIIIGSKIIIPSYE